MTDPTTTRRGATITGWGTALPPVAITNADFAARLDTSDEWIRERTGMQVRHHGGTTAGLAVEAGRAAMAMAGVTGDQIDYVLLCTTTPDWHVPATAARVQQELGITGGASDLNAACSGFVYGLVHAHALLGMGLRRILLIGSETLSRITDQEDRNTAILFADGAGAIVLEAVDGPGQLLSFDMGNDGSAIELLYCDIGDTLQMVGKEVFRRAVTVMVDSARRSMATADLSGDDLALVVPHQANIRIIEAAVSRLGVSIDNVAVSIHKYGNTSSASIPLALVDAIDEGRVKAGDLVLLVGFGAGMSWASAILRWPDVTKGAAR